MADALDTYIGQLNTLADNLDSIVSTTIEKNGNLVVGMVKKRLIGSGKDADDKLIGGGQYSAVTIADKNRFSGNEGITSHFTLFHFGDFHDGMFVQQVGKNALITSSDQKTNLLISEYGEAILGLNDEETEVVAEQIIDPELQKIINKQISFIEL